MLTGPVWVLVHPDIFAKRNSRLERRVGDYEHVLLQRTQIRFPAPTSDSSQLPVVPVTGDIMISSFCGGHSYRLGIHTQMKLNY